MRMFVDIYVFVVQMRWIAGRLCCLVHPRHSPPLWIADQVRNDGVVVASVWIDACAGMTGRCGWCWLVVTLTLPCGYCLEASMTTTLPCPSGLRIKSAMT